MNSPSQAWLDALVPPVYARYQPLLEQTLTHFLWALSGERQMALWKALEPEKDPSERLMVILRACPSLQKVGQLLARDPRLSPELGQRLQQLESCLPSTPAESYHWPVELRPGACLAEGSVACVFAANWGEHQVVCKRLKPGIAQALEEEFEIWQRLSGLFPQWCQDLGFPDLDFESLVVSLIRLLQDELQPHLEQQHLLRAAARFEGRPEIHIPKVYPQILEDGIVLERIEGTPLLEHPQVEEYFSLAIRVLLSEPFFSAEPEVIFHLDPHPGNLWVSNQGRLVLLDWGSTMEFSKEQRILLTHALLAAWRGDTDDWKLFAGQWVGGEVGPCPRKDRLSSLFEPGCWGSRLPAELVMLRKVLFHLEGIEARLGQGDLLHHLFIQAAGQFLSELPLRLMAPAHWRGFGSHLSNLDILRHAVLSFLGPPPSRPELDPPGSSSNI